MTEFNQDQNPTILGRFDPLNDSNEDHLFTQLRLEESNRKDLIESGYKYALAEYWTTNLDRQKIREGIHFLRLNPSLKGELDVVFFPRGFVYDIGLQAHFDQEYFCAPFQQRKIVQGNCLRVLLASNCLDCIETVADDEMDQAIEQIRIVFGGGSAKSKIMRQLLHLDNSRIEAHEVKHLFIDDIGDGSDPGAIINFAEGEGNDSKCAPVPKHARFLLSSAFLASAPWKRFILIWFAIEAILGESGKKRERWCKSLPCGDAINSEMLRLKDLRVQQVHYGSTQADDLDCVSAMWIIRLACVESPALRGRIAVAYAEWINQQRTRPKQIQKRAELNLLLVPRNSESAPEVPK